MENKKLPSVEEMMMAGMHFGHRTNRWHPKMKPFIFADKKGVYIIDLRKSQEQLATALDFMAQLIFENKTILFVGTKNQVKGPLKAMAKAINQPYIVGKWLGGFLTNFSMVKKSVQKYKELVADKESGRLDRYTKKERSDFDREIKKLEERVGGLTNVSKLPDALFVWDIKEEETAVKEARVKNIPVIAICDTNVDPSLVNYPIAGNDDSTKTISLITETIRYNLSQIKPVTKDEEKKEA
ncbi:MAG: 30S ribosomal protein S2 [Candidatus Parcubacteria bacterium]|jgi:small subunit ribosomal protein S2|nr:MAG: 30S ribosomal protein S2 [Candidatus Parcubacteria bacterium]